MPWDIFSLKTAASVADNYSYSIDTRATSLIVLFILMFWLSGYCDVNVTNKKIRLSAAVFCLCLLFSSCSYVQSDHAQSSFRFYDKLFTPTTMTYRNGTLVTLLIQGKYLSVERPRNYSAARAHKLISSYEDTADSLIPDELPNIIVIMNEAFSDLNVLGDFTTNEDYIPFVHSVLAGKENTISGFTNVSVLGGNTANSEYEFLTSHTMAFLPQGSIPYQQYVKKESFSLASYLKSLGYETIGLHPYGASGWQRDQIYPLLGFDTFYSLEDFDQPEKIRKYVSDKENYEKILALYEAKEAGKPLFLFNVTMQNHSSYTESFDNFSPSITVEDSDSTSLSNYLSLLKISDREIESLLSYFEQQKENTIILFFGDHQPTDSVVSDIWKINKKNPHNLSPKEQQLRYKTPFFLWANYDIAEETDVETSVNYLSLRLFEASGIPLNNYYRFIARQEESFPVISAIQTRDSSFNYRELKEVKKELNDYATIQYYHLFEENAHVQQ